MWRTNNKQKSSDTGNASHSYFSKSAIIQGDLHSNDDIRIDGTISGNIHCSGKIVIGNDGIVTGDVQCSELEINGCLTGNVEVQELLLLHCQSSYRGDALIHKIQIEQGADFFGTCTMERFRHIWIGGNTTPHHLINKTPNEIEPVQSSIGWSCFSPKERLRGRLLSFDWTNNNRRSQ